MVLNLRLVLIIEITTILIIGYANAQLLSPAPQQELTDLEKSKMQTVYEDQEKKVMLPYDPDKVMMYLAITIMMAFISGIITGYTIQKYRKPKSI